MFTGDNTYTGDTFVRDGNLQVGVAGTGSLDDTDVVVGGAGQPAILSGTGTIGDPLSDGATVTINAMGTLSPGDSTGDASGDLLGTLTVNGDATLNAMGSMAFQIQNPTLNDTETAALDADLPSPIPNIPGDHATELAGTISPTQHDHLEMTGMTLNLNAGGTIDVTSFGSFYPRKGDVYNLIDANIVANDFVDGFVNGGGFRYRSGSQNDLFDLKLPDLTATGPALRWDISLFISDGILVIVPEPSRALLLLMGVVGLATRRRR